MTPVASKWTAGQCPVSNPRTDVRELEELELHTIGAVEEHKHLICWIFRKVVLYIEIILQGFLGNWDNREGLRF